MTIGISTEHALRKDVARRIPLSTAFSTRRKAIDFLFRSARC